VAKDSKPDIQVLEDRVARLKSQLTEYKQVRLYNSTKRRLSAVGDELAECISIINSVISTESNSISPSSISAVQRDDPDRSEFTEETDLFDIFLSGQSKDSPYVGPYSPRNITITYGKRIQLGYEVSTTEGCGILQVNQFWALLHMWYVNRFIPESRNPKFFFQSTRIHEWVDLLIIAAGRAINQQTLPEFTSEIVTWVGQLNGPNDNLRSLPRCVMQLQDQSFIYGTKEAVLLELMVKPYLYDEAFYPGERNSIRDGIIKNGRFDKEELLLSKILADTPGIVCTSSFDISKYKEVI